MPRKGQLRRIVTGLRPPKGEISRVRGNQPRQPEVVPHPEVHLLDLRCSWDCRNLVQAVLVENIPSFNEILAESKFCQSNIVIFQNLHIEQLKTETLPHCSYFCLRLNYLSCHCSWIFRLMYAL